MLESHGGSWKSASGCRAPAGCCGSSVAVGGTVRSAAGKAARRSVLPRQERLVFLPAGAIDFAQRCPVAGAVFDFPIPALINLADIMRRPTAGQIVNRPAWMPPTAEQ